MSDSLERLQEAVENKNKTDGLCDTIISLRSCGRGPSHVVVCKAQFRSGVAPFCSALCPYRGRVEHNHFFSPLYHCRLWGDDITEGVFRLERCIQATASVELL
jgi:hypothetical protein